MINIPESGGGSGEKRAKMRITLGEFQDNFKYEILKPTDCVKTFQCGDVSSIVFANEGLFMRSGCAVILQ